MNTITQNQSEAEQFLGSISSDVPVPNARPDMTGRISLTDFLGAFYPDENEPIRLRAFKPKGVPDTDDNRARKLVVTRAGLKNDKQLQTSLQNFNQNRGMYFAVNAGGDKKEDITRVNAFFMETDDLNIEEQHTALDKAPLPPSIRVQTRKSVHAYWLVAGKVTVSEAEQVQRHLISYFGSDPAIKDASRVMRVPYYNHLHYSPHSKSLERQQVKIIEFEPTRRYTLGEMQDAFSASPDAPDASGNTTSQNKLALTNQVFKTHTEYNEELIRRIRQDSTAKQKDGWIEVRGKCHGGKGNSGVGINISSRAVFCRNGCDYSCVAHAWEMPERNTAVQLNSIVVEEGVANPWPTLNDAALHGLAGEFIKFIREETEADHVAVLVQFLIAFGNYVGRGPFLLTGPNKHYTKLSAILVGATATGRKGTSLSEALRVFKLMDPEWKKNNVSLGLSTGEGLIHSVRDPSSKSVPVKDANGNPTGEYKEEVTDVGVTDKRLLVTETEFASVLRRQTKEGNTLSVVIRQAWDDDDLKTMTKNNSETATDTHISLIGHISSEELQATLDGTEAFNGFLNRFLFCCSERSKLLPRGGKLRDEDFTPLVEELRAAADFAHGIGGMRRDTEAEELWEKVYAHLNRPRHGIFGGVTARASVQVLRLSCIYALLDRSPVINEAHLKAALALWEYSEASARHIFGDRTGNRVADEILKALREVAGAGLTRSEISNDIFNRNVAASKILAALKLLQNAKLASCAKEFNSDGKRQAERWFAITPDILIADSAPREIPDEGVDMGLNSSNSFDSTESRPAYMAVVEHE